MFLVTLVEMVLMGKPCLITGRYMDDLPSRNLGDFQGGRSVTWTVWWILLWLRLIQWSLMEFEIITHYYNVGPRLL